MRLRAALPPQCATRRLTLRQRLGAIAEAGGKGARLFPLSVFGRGVWRSMYAVFLVSSKVCCFFLFFAHGLAAALCFYGWLLRLSVQFRAV